MSRLAIDDMFYGKPERVRYVAGGGGGYGGYQTGPHYYSDGDDYYSHRQSGHSGRAPVYPTSVSGRPILPDVRLSVPMDSLRCVEKVKEALDISGVYSVNCDIPSQTVTVSGNVAPQALLKRVKHVKRKSKILSYTSLYTDSGHMAGSHHGRTSSSSATYGAAPGYGSSAYGSSYYRSGRLPSPPRDHSYYSRNNQHTFARPAGYNDHYRPSHDHHYTNYY
jgi:copper chaperone CopZ